ncbi:MAG: MFS transporter, partial [Candidatus Eremiobacteraeota bacterium]|nr:MFS transporter [Candidatus Eremiobacteraeota bacterium]
MMVTAGDSIFASRSFRQYYIGQTFSYLGDGLRLLAVPLLVYYLTHSALSTGVSLVLEVAPFAFLGPIAGSFADRLDRRRLMITCDFVRFLIMATFAITYATHTLTLTMVYGGLIMLSVCASFFLGGQASSIPYLLGPERSTEAVSALVAAESATNLVTPVIGGALFSLLGPLPALTMNAFTYGISQFSLSRVPTLGPDKRNGAPSLHELMDDIGQGFGFLVRDVPMRTMALTSLAMNAFGFGSYAILIPYLKRQFGASDHQVGFFLGISALGAIAGSLFAGKTANRWPFGRALVTAMLFDALIFVPFVFASNLYVGALFWALANMAANFEIAQIIGWRLRITPEHMVGRVTGAVRLVVLLGMVPSVVILGYIADHVGAHVAMAICAFGYVII